MIAFLPLFFQIFPITGFILFFSSLVLIFLGYFEAIMSSFCLLSSNLSPEVDFFSPTCSILFVCFVFKSVHTIFLLQDPWQFAIKKNSVKEH